MNPFFPHPPGRPPRCFPSLPERHKHTYSKIDRPKLTPDPPATIRTVEWDSHRARTELPKGPSIYIRIRIPRVGISAPLVGCSVLGWCFPWDVSLATSFHKSNVQPPLARMRSTSIRSESDPRSSHTDATVKGCVVNLEIEGILIRKCCPGAHDRNPGETNRNRTVRPASNSAWAYPGGGTYDSIDVDNGARKLEAMDGEMA